MFRCTLLLGLLMWASPAWSDESPTATSRSLAARSLAVIDVIAAHHIAAPPRQELVRQLIAALRRTARLDPPLGLGPRLTNVTDDETFRELLTEEWQTVLSNMQDVSSAEDANTVLAQAVTSMLMMSPGRNLLSEAREHKVEEQFAANRYVGTGIVLGGARNGEPPVMSKVFPEGPAHKAGALDGDLIREIDGVSTEDMPLVEVVRMLRGPGGSDVEVLLQREDQEPRRYTITRGVVPINHTHSERKTHKGKTIEVIRFDRLTSATVSDLRKIEREMVTPPDAILLELQFGEFGLHHAVLLADALLDGGTIGSLQTATDNRTFEASRDVLFGDIPLFAVVSARTSGTIEWIAAALQDSGRATLLGRQTAGQPFVAEPFDVPGTDWVLTLSSGVLRRADGRRLLRSTPGVPNPMPRAIFVNQEIGEVLHQGVPRTHDGGVVPDHADSVTQAQAGTGQDSTPQMLALVPDTEALKLVQRLLAEAD